MTLETFFKKFDTFTNAPNAVGKMRELVLELAIRGNLTADNQNNRDNPSNPSAFFSIPADWRWTTLSEAADCRASGKVSPSFIADSAWVLDLEDINGNSGQITQTATFAERRSLSTKAAFLPGDVLYGKLRPYLNKVVVAKRPGYCTTEIIPLRPLAGLIPEFLRYFLRSATFLSYAAQKNYGMKMPRLGTKDLEAAAIPLPPLAEQKRIVAKVDELMALCDRLEAQQQERETRHAALARASLARFVDAPTPANLNLLFDPLPHSKFNIQHSTFASPADLRKSILTLAVQGKLVPQDPKDEPAAKLWKMIEKERRSFAEENRFRMHVDADVATEPFELPANWKWAHLASLFNVVTDGDHLPSPKSKSGVAFLTIGNITTGKLEFDGCRFVPSSYFDALASFRQPSRGDILYTIVGATYGRPALVEGDRPFCVQRHIAILKPSANMDAGFLLSFLKSPLCYDQATASTTGTAQPTIPLGALRKFVVPLPSLAEQRRIVAKVDELMALVDALETQLATARSSATQLLQAAVAELTTA